MNAAWIVFRKELTDALRDRRTLLVVLLGSVAIGPLVLVLLSSLVGGIERRAEARELLVHGIEHAPTLRNYLERATYVLREAPADHERQLAAGRLGEPVVVIRPGFEDEWAAARVPLVEVLASSADRRASAAAPGVLAVLRGFNQEQAVLRLALRGVPPAVLEAVQFEERDLADPAARAAQLAVMVPMFVLMAVLYGALAAALDTTAGERERGSLEPLLMNPPARATLVVGKWAAVSVVALLVAMLSCLSFVPGQWLMRSETLAAMFRFEWREALLFVLALLPLAMAASALLMALAMRCRSVKEAQANASLLLLVFSLAPLVVLVGPDGEAPWHRWVPALAQFGLMGRILRGAELAAYDWWPPALVALALTALALRDVSRRLSRGVLG